MVKEKIKILPGDRCEIEIDEDEKLPFPIESQDYDLLMYTRKFWIVTEDPKLQNNRWYARLWRWINENRITYKGI